jgi:hypothetical protein
MKVRAPDFLCLTTMPPVSMQLGCCQLISTEEIRRLAEEKLCQTKVTPGWMQPTCENNHSIGKNWSSITLRAASSPGASI